MPHPARLSAAQILAEARSLLEASGPEGLTMRALARRLAVSAPSLYFHVESREDLLNELIAAGLRELGARMDEAGTGGTAMERARRLGAGYIAFAERSPQLFTLIFGPCHEQVDPALGARASGPILEVATEVVGPERSLALAAGLWALVHGYTVLRLAAQFRVDPDHEASFWFSLEAMLTGAALASRVPAR